MLAVEGLHKRTNPREEQVFFISASSTFKKVPFFSDNILNCSPKRDYFPNNNNNNNNNKHQVKCSYGVGSINISTIKSNTSRCLLSYDFKFELCD